LAVNFALFLSPEGIALAHRQASGHWAFVGETRIDVEDLDGALAELKAIAVKRSGPDPETVLILPDDQILYTSFMAPTAEDAQTRSRIEESLDGLTPYPVSELVYDFRPIEEDRVKVAVVAQETLEEARSFAAGYGFKGAGFAAMPPVERFPGVPVFGDTGAMESLLGLDALQFGPDEWIDPDAPSEMPDSAGAIAAPTAAAAAVSSEPPPAEKDMAPAQAEDTQAEDTDEVDAAQPDPGAEVPQAEPENAEVAPELEPEAEAADTAGLEPDPGAEATPETPAVEPDRASEESDPTPIDDPLAPEVPLVIEDPNLNNPVEPLAESGPEEIEPPEQSAPTSTEPDLEPVSQAGTDSAAAPTKARRVRFTPTPTDQDRVEEDTPPEDDIPDMPHVAFAVRRGKSATSPDSAGAAVGARPSRIGFGSSPATPPDASLHPDADIGPTAAAPSTGSAPLPRVTKLAGQLERVRDAAKSRSTPSARISRGGASAADGKPQPPLTGTRDTPFGTPTARVTKSTHATPATPVTGRTVFDPPESAEKPRKASGPSMLSKLGSAVSGAASGLTTGAKARRVDAKSAKKAKAETSPSDTEETNSASKSTSGKSASSSAEASLTGGLLGRKTAASPGPSFRTGLILTVVLLALLAAIAIWSVLFLPESQVARLFTGSQGDTELIASDPIEATEAEPVAETIAMAEPDLPPSDPASEEIAALEPEPILAPDPTAPQSLPAVEATQAPAVEEELPDIDADLVLAPLPPLPEALLPSLEETERIYAEDGIWPRTPDRPSLAPFDTLNALYVAGIDPSIIGFDAIALPDAATDPSEQFQRIPSPPPFGTEFTVDALGQVAPTPEGVLTPAGAFVRLGRPPVEPLQRPREPVAEAAPETQDFGVEQAILGTFRPTPRPGDLIEQRERQVLGGLSVTELSEQRPSERPVSAQEAAAQASLFTPDAAQDTTEPGDAANTSIGGSALAIAASRVPTLRPANIEAMVAAAVRTPAAEAVPAAAVAPQPSIPSNASVSRAATDRNAIRLRNVNLIGVTGTPSDRTALVRLPSGRFVRVGVGDRLDGGRVAAIGENSLQYIRRGQNITLEIPG